MSAKNKARFALESERIALEAERRHKAERLERLREHVPLRGCERIARRAIERYEKEIRDLDERIGLIDANLEGLG